MARKKKTKKKKTRQARKSSKTGWSSGFDPLKIFLFILLVGLMVAGIAYGAKHFFLYNPIFNIKDVEIINVRGYSFEEGERILRQRYTGENIFKVNLKQAQDLIKNKYPQFKKVEVRRNLPDVLEVNMVTRAPAAVIESAGGIVIDSEGVVLTVGEGSKDLVGIKGVSFFLNIPSRGQTIKNRDLEEALSILEVLRKKLRGRIKDIKYIDVSNRNNIILGADGVEIKMGAGDLSEKVDKLKDIMRDPNIYFADIKYIDLRFKDVVIAPR